MKQYFDSVGIPVDAWNMALWGFPTALWAFGVGWWRCRRLDARLARRKELAP